MTLIHITSGTGAGRRILSRVLLTVALLQVPQGGAQTFTVPPSLGGSLSNAQYGAVVLDCSVVDCQGPQDIVIDSGGAIRGRIDLGDSTSELILQNLADGSSGSGWRSAGSSAFSDGDVHFDNGGFWATGLPRHSTTIRDELAAGQEDQLVVTTIDFGAGTNQVVNRGTFVAGFAAINMRGNAGGPFASLTTLANLDSFRNSGLIVLGAVGTGQHAEVYTGGGVDVANVTRPEFGGTDGSASLQLPTWGSAAPIGLIDDVLHMPGTTFEGVGDSTLLLDAALSLGVPQRDCRTRGAAPRRSTVPGDRGLLPGRETLPGADCLDLRGGSTAGHTEVIVRDVFPLDLGAPNPEGIVIVDVEGGQSAEGHFSLSALSDGYVPELDAIQKGLYLYPLAYDGSRQQHVLVGLPSQNALQLPLLLQTVQAVGRESAAAWVDRGRLSNQSGGYFDGSQFWLRLSSFRGSRDVSQQVGTLNVSRQFQNDFERSINLLTAGFDLFTAETAVAQQRIGLAFGYANAEMTFDGQPNETEMDGAHAHIFGEVRWGGTYLDFSAGQTWLQIDHFAPELIRESPIIGSASALDGRARSQNLDIEGGLKAWEGETLMITPFARVQWSRARLESLTIDSGTTREVLSQRVRSGDQDSVLAGVGANVEWQQTLGAGYLHYQLSAMLSQELQGETSIAIESNAAQPWEPGQVSHRFDGMQTAVDARIEYAFRDTVRFGFGLGAEVGDDYSSYGAFLNARVHW